MTQDGDGKFDDCSTKFHPKLEIFFIGVMN